MSKSVKNNLDTLPEGVLVNIFKFLYPRDIGKVSAVNRRLHMAANNPLVWERFAKWFTIDPVPDSQIDKSSNLWQSQLACKGTAYYKYAVCSSFGKPIQDTGMTFDRVSYGRIRLGSVVVIHKHRPVCFLHQRKT